MLDIRILGSGCDKCDRMASLTEEVAIREGHEFTLEKVRDIKTILSFGVVSTPALVVNGEVKCFGVVPNRDRIANILKTSGEIGNEGR